MSRLTRDGTAEPISRDQILRHERGQGNIHFSCSADHVQDWQPYPVDPYSCYMCDHTCIHACAPAATRSYLTTVSVIFCTFYFCLLGQVAFSEYFCTIILVSSLYGEYVVRFFLPDGVFLPCDHGLDFLYQLMRGFNQSINQPTRMGGSNINDKEKRQNMGVLFIDYNIEKNTGETMSTPRSRLVQRPKPFHLTYTVLYCTLDKSAALHAQETTVNRATIVK